MTDDADRQFELRVWLGMPIGWLNLLQKRLDKKIDKRYLRRRRGQVRRMLLGTQIPMSETREMVAAQARDNSHA